MDGFGNLTTQLTRDHKAVTVVVSIHSIMTGEMGFANRLIADKGTEFTGTWNSSLG